MDILPIYTLCRGFRNLEDYKRCDKILKILDPYEMDETTMLEIVKMTYKHQDYLPSWEKFLERVDLELYRRGSDPVKFIEILAKGEKEPNSKD